MKKYRATELVPAEEFPVFTKQHRKESEMTDFELGFLLGLIKEKKPKKIVEVGVAAGSTTVTLWDFLDSLDMQSEMYSVDLNKEYWQDNSLKTGYLAYEDKREHLQRTHLLIGDTVAGYIKEIGKDIDFLILDTSHTLPGEVMDFLVCLPYLKDGAVVLLHDVGLNHDGYETSYDAEYYQNAFSTKLLFDVVKAEKIYMKDDSRYGGFPNIAAFIVGRETRESIVDVFSSLSITWQMFYDDKMIYKYVSAIKENYDSYEVGLLEMMIRVQKKTYSFNAVKKHYRGDVRLLEKKWKKSQKVYIYGAGFWGRMYYEFAKASGFEVSGIVISDDQDLETAQQNLDAQVYHLGSVIDKENNPRFVIAVDNRYYDIILKNLFSVFVYSIL